MLCAQHIVDRKTLKTDERKTLPVDTKAKFRPAEVNVMRRAL